MVRARRDFKKIIIKKGFSLRGLSLKAGLSPTTVQQIYKNNTLYPATAKKICDAVGMAFDDLFEVEDDFAKEA